ncbi:MAG: hypothetical protein BGP06_09375 [Rhizobiales bacterium 65-9]|nr:hypothetical protein [Hyphomicrobiales bacterium]OJY38668.1 MAG: hypothetical protein BGP06_09375 [Rhizobiales bacterium 65-9]
MAATDRRLDHDHQFAIERAAHELTAALGTMSKSDPDTATAAQALTILGSLSWASSKIKSDAYKAARWLEGAGAGAVLPSPHVASSQPTATPAPMVRTADEWAAFYAGLDQERLGACSKPAPFTAAGDNGWPRAHTKVGLTPKSEQAAGGGWERAIARVNEAAAG